MADRYWLGVFSNDPTDDENWAEESGGAGGFSIPGVGDDVTFDANGDNPCESTEHWTIASLTITAGYTAKFDLDTFNLTIGDGGDIILDSGGEFDMGTGIISITNGDFDYEHVTTLTRGSSTVVFNGTCNWKAQASKSLWSITISSGSDVTATSTGTNIPFTGVLQLTGTLAIGGRRLLPQGTADVYLNDGSSLQDTGAGRIQFNLSTVGHGLLSYHANATVTPELVINSVNVGAVFVPAMYGTDVRISTTNLACNVDLSVGGYTFTEGLTLQSLGTGNVSLRNTTNGPTITVEGDLTIDLDAAGNITIDDSGQTVDWDIDGDIINQVTGGGAFTWPSGTGDITLSGTANQDINLDGATSPDFVINKTTSGTVAFDEVDLNLKASTMTDGFTVTSGDVVLTGALSCGGLAVLAGSFDNDTFAVAVNGAVDVDGGTLNLGAGQYTVQGDWLIEVAATVTRNAASVVDLAGTGDAKGASGERFRNLTVSGIYATVGDVWILDDLLVTGQFTVNNLCLCQDVIDATGGTINGSGTLVLDQGVSIRGGVISVDVEIRRGTPTINAGTYSGDWLIRLGTGSDKTFTFGEAVEFQGNVTFRQDQDAPRILTIDTNDQDITFGGDVTIEETGTGTLTWIKGTGDIIFTTGGITYTDSVGVNLGNVVLTGSVGFTLASAMECDDFTSTDDLTVAGAFTITVNGNFLLVGTNGDPVTWIDADLDITGTAIAHYVNVSGSDGKTGAGSTVIAIDNCTDGGGNASWVFGTPYYMVRQMAVGGVV